MENETFKVGDEVYGVNDGGNGLPNGRTKMIIVDKSFSHEASGLLDSNNWDFVVKCDYGYRKVNSFKAQFQLIKKASNSLEIW